MLHIKNQAFVTIKIDGSEIDYARIKDITLPEGNGAFVPTVKIELDDPISLLSKSRAISEGNTIEILIAKSIDSTVRARRYRVFGNTRDNPVANPNLNILGILDCPLFFTASARECYIGTSDSVLREVAGKVGLRYSPPTNGRVTNDSQTWWDICTNRARFIYETTRHGWMDAQSGMASVVTSFHELRYRNLIDEINTPIDNIKYVFTHNAPVNRDKSKKLYVVKEARDRSTSGLMTHWQNYGSTRSSNHISGSQYDRTLFDVKVPGAYLAINQEVAEMVERVRFDYSQIDCTNTHQHYQEALYQNIKSLALFTETMSVLVTEITDVQLFDVVIYRQADADPMAKVRNDDIYIVIGKTIVIRGGIHYAERIQLSRISLTMKGQAKLMSSASLASAPSILAKAPTNVSAIGVLANALGLGNLPNLLTSCVSASSSLTNIASSLGIPVSGSVTQLNSLLGALQTGNHSNTQSALASLSSMLGQQNTLANDALNVLAMLRPIVSQVVAESGNKPTTITAAVTKQNSVTTAITTATQMTMMNSLVADTSLTVIDALPQNQRSTSTAVEARARANAVKQTTEGSSSQLEQMWNVVASAVSGLPQQSPDATSFMIRFANMFASKTITKEQLIAFVQREITFQNNRKKTWASNRMFLPTSATPTENVAMLSSILNNL